MDEQEHITPVDQYVIDFILALRKEKKLSQRQIGDLLGVKRSFIGNIESPNNRAKYNVRHINILADYFDLSPRDFLPEQPLPHNYPSKEKKRRIKAKHQIGKPFKKSIKRTKR
ncbi:MAG: helix-turn-helix transcriptional regulator [Bacteroidetes bacterium]|nr:helix-turn-helix transcriptional regulator [Bacteroidota bacterium]